MSVACLAQCVIPFYSPTYSFSYSLARFPTCLPTSYPQGFTELGFDIGHSETPIIPVMLGDEDLAKAFSARLFEEGVFASPIVFPMVAKGKARVRVIVSASFSKEDCDAGLAAFKRVAESLSK